MAKKTYILTISNRTALARNKRLREAGASVYVTGSTVVGGTQGIDEKGVVDVSVVGSGNVVTDARLSSDGSTIVLNRGGTFLDEESSNERYLRKDQDDSTEYTITMGGATVTGDVSVGGDLTVDGLTSATTVYVSDSIGTPQYADGFDGYGWQISNIGENNWHLTLDSLTVRKNMTVYEMVISKIRAIGGQFIVSAANGFIKTVENGSTDDEAFYTSEGEIFIADGEEFHTVREGEKTDTWAITLEDECMFQAHDLMRCQHYTGDNIKAYWVEISSVVNGVIYVPCSEFDDPLSGGGVPEVGDEVVLCGNTTDTTRQNLILISATDDGLPRIDVHQGVHEKSFNLENVGGTLGTIRTRLGCLDDIQDDWFDADNQPQGYGLYGENAYLRGNFVLANTGEDVSTLFQVIQGNITALLTANESINYLSNSSFESDFNKWDNNACTIVSDSTVGRNVAEMSVLTNYLQQNQGDYATVSNFSKDEEGLYIPRDFILTFYARAAYTLQISGYEVPTVRITFAGEDESGFEEYDSLDVSVVPGTDFQLYEFSFKWNGTGNFYIRLESSALNIYPIHIYDVKIVGDNVTYFTTLFSQTVASISALSQRIEQTQTSIEEWVAGTYVSVDVYNNAIQGLNDTINSISGSLSNYVEVNAFSSLFAQYFEDATGKSVSAFVGAYVGKDSNGYIESGVLLYGDQILLAGYVNINGNFIINEDGTLYAKDAYFDGEIHSKEGEIAGFTLSTNKLTASQAVIEFVSGNYDMLLQSQYIYFKNSKTDVNAYFGAQTLSSITGDILIAPIQITVKRTDVAGTMWGNAGIYLDITNGARQEEYNYTGNIGLYVVHGNITGFRLHALRVFASTQLTTMDSLVYVCYAGLTLTLPSDAEDGQMYFIKMVSTESGTTTIRTSGSSDIINTRRAPVEGTTSISFTTGNIYILMYDATYHIWHGGYTNCD